MSGAGRFGVGFLLGAVIVGIATMGLGEADPVASTTTVTTAAPADPVVEPWFEPGEIMLGATALLPRSLTIEDDTAYFDYDLVGLGPSLHADEDTAEAVGDHTAAPERWLLRTVSGQSVEAESGPFATSVRFELPGPNEEVESVTLLGWRIGAPFGEQIELAIEAGASGTTRRGTATIETVLEQSVSTIVQINFDRVDDPWQADVLLRPLDSHWRATWRQGGGLQLIWEGTDAPGVVVLEDAGFEMRPVVGEVLVIDEAGLR